jgi:branched-chain amino acid transport system substrate-binding protein
MSATLTKVKALKPDVLVVSAHEKGPPLAIRQMQEMRVDVPMLALTHCDSSQVAEQMGEAAEYALCASQWDASLAYEDEWFGSAADYAALFEETFDYPPPYQAAESSAGVLVFADALERAGSLEPEAVREALAATDIKTFYGPVKFDETGKNTAKPMVLYQIQDGQYKVVAPTEWASAELVHPMPTWAEREGS